MRKVIAGAALLLAAAGAIFWFGGRVVEVRRGRNPWPRNLGTLEDVARRYRTAPTNSTARQLVVLAETMHIALAPGAPVDAGRDQGLQEPLRKYVIAELERNDPTIATPSPAVEEFVHASDAALNTIRDLLLGSALPVWETNLARDVTPLPNLRGHIELHRLLAVRALEKARHGDPTAWSELHSIWRLAGGLWGRPEIISNMVALALTRTVSALARKMPEAEEPPWFAELRDLDVMRAMIGAQQAEMWQLRLTAQTHAHPSEDGVLATIRRHIDQFQAAWVAERIRSYAERVDRTRVCRAPDAAVARQMPSFTGVLSRAARFEVEREATIRILQMRRGETPSTESRCAEGRWLVTPTSLKYTPAFEGTPGYSIPLEYELRPR